MGQKIQCIGNIGAPKKRDVKNPLSRRVDKLLQDKKDNQQPEKQTTKINGGKNYV